MADFDSFKQQFKGDLVGPSDPGYEAAIDRWAHNAAKRAKIVAFVKDTDDISAAIKYAKAAGLPLAIRGGGHSASGASSSENGLVIDLSRYINTVKVETENKLAYIGGGSIWQTVDEAAIEHGLATVGGTVQHTGVGGLILGGGYGWLSARHGLVIDNLVQVTMVVADGSVLTASPTEHSDLFWGIRGGGSNFGVVSEFVLRLHPQRRTVFAGPLVFIPPQVEAVGATLDAWYPTQTENEGILVAMTLGPDGNPCVVLMVFYNGSETEGREHFKRFLDLKPVADMAKEIPYEKLNSLQNDQVPPGTNYFMKGGLLSGLPSKDVNLKNLLSVTEVIKQHGVHAVMLAEFFPHEKINSVPPGTTPHRRDMAGNVQVLAKWTENSPEKSKAGRDAAHALCDLLPRSGEGYANYAADSDAIATGSEPVDKAKDLYRDNYPRLQAIKKKYDPELVFNKWFVITPA